jgi:hypothetical protein
LWLLSGGFTGRATRCLDAAFYRSVLRKTTQLI